MDGAQGRSPGRDRRPGHGDQVRLEDRRPRFPSAPTSGSRKDGQTWYFNIAGIYDGDKNVDKTQFLFRYDYFDENRRAGKGTVSWYVIKVADPSRRRGDRGDARLEVRELAGGNQDPAREGRHRGLRETDRRHRRDDHRRSVGRVLHHPARRRQYHGAVGARAHGRAGGAEDARVLGRANPRPRAGRIAGPFGRRRLGGARSHGRVCRARVVQYRDAAGVRLQRARAACSAWPSPWRSACSPARCPPCPRCV